MIRLTALPLALLAASCASVPAQPGPDDQAALAEELRGRTAGEPASCVRQQDLGDTRSIGEGVLIFEGRSGQIYVNRPANGCPIVDRDRIIVTRTYTGQLCRGDLIDVVERNVGTIGSCSLGDFTRYSRRAN